MSSPAPPFGPPPSGAPLGGPPPPPPSGSPPPPPPPPPPSSQSDYFFGFVITFVVLVLLFIGCGLGSWRRFRLVGTAWDVRLQDMEGNPFVVRKRARRRLVRPVLLETWTARGVWTHVQPVSVAWVWSRSKLVARRKMVEASLRDAEGAVVRGMGATLRAHVRPRRRCEQAKPPPVQLPPPEAVQVAVMIAMPSRSSGQTADGRGYVGQPGAGEYEIGVVRIPWPSGEGT